MRHVLPTKSCSSSCKQAVDLFDFVSPAASMGATALGVGSLRDEGAAVAWVRTVAPPSSLS